MITVLEKYFDNVDDPRSARNQRHPFMTLVGTTLLAVLSGIDSFSGMQDFTEMHFDELKQYFNLSAGVPSHDTYQRFWDSISPDEFAASFHEFTKSLKQIASTIINIDGKTIRNSGHEKALHMVSAWCYTNKLILAQTKVDSKSNEIIAIPVLLKLLDLKDKIITIDAMGAQRNIVQQIIDKEGDYVISLKGNQGTLHRDVKLYLEDKNNHQLTNENNDKGHGRIEQRIAAISHDTKRLQDTHKWPSLKSIGQITSHITRNNKTSTETRYYISSLQLTAQALNDIARSHWGIENSLHWMLDVVFNEDKSCIRNDNGAENMDILRKWALNILYKVKNKPDQSIKSIMRKNSMSINHLVASVKKIFHA